MNGSNPGFGGSKPMMLAQTAQVQPAQPWAMGSGFHPSTLMQPTTGAWWRQPPPGQASDGGIIGGTAIEQYRPKPVASLGSWRSAAQPIGVLSLGQLPGMQAQQAQVTSTSPVAPTTTTTTLNPATTAPAAPFAGAGSLAATYGAGTQYVQPGTTPPAGLSATTMVGGQPLPTAYQMVGNQAVMVDPLLDYYLSLVGSGA